MLTLNMLLYFIRDLSPVIVQGIAKKGSFIGVKLFSREAWEMEAGTELSVGDAHRYLYIGNLSEIFRFRQSLPEQVTVLAVRDEELSPQEMGEISCVLIFAEDKYKIPYLMNRMMAVFTRVSNWDKNMHIAALEGRTIQELLDISEEMLKHPMIIFDAAFNVLAHTKTIAATSENFRITIQKGYTDARIMEQVKKKHIFSRLKKGEALVAPAAEDEDGQTNIYFSFYSGQVLLGYACIFHDKTEPDEGYLELLKLFTENLNFCMEREYEDRRHGQMMYETFLVNLMHSGAAPSEQQREQIKNIENLPESGRFVMGLLYFGEDAKDQLSYLGRVADREMWNVRPFIFEEYICLLKILDEGDKPIHDWEMKNMRKLFRGYGFTFGLSNPFYRIWDLRYAFEQARAALHFGRKENQTFCLYRDYYYQHLLACMEKQMPLRQLQPEFYRQIKQYDHENKTRYREMILTYLECDCNATRAAQQLYLHRNTVHNAVHFVQERWDIDIADTEIKKMFMLSDLIDQYLTRGEEA